MLDVRLENRSGYDTESLRRFVRRGLAAYGVRGIVHVTILASPIRSRGCATVGGRRMVLAMAAPSRTTSREFLRRLARLIEHEAAHLRGVEHKNMPRELLYSLGPTPAWAKGIKIPHRGRAPDQLKALRSTKKCGGGKGKKARDFDKKALMREVDADQKRADRQKLVTLRQKIAQAIQARREGRPEVRAFCLSERMKARARIADLREKLREEYKRYAYAERLGARGACARERRGPTLEIERLRLALAEETRFQKQMRLIAKGARARRTPRTTLRERQGESDDEVRANIPADLIPLFERVKRSIRGSSRKSRTEAFMQYVEENPGEEYGAIEDKTDALVRQLEREQRRRR